ncbi:MAG TPA: methylmalonyl-CoA mutase, partial [Firmicutes bacterium]|nr:methylmalonyl-CoA mutase [Bacillota bacterium]
VAGSYYIEALTNKIEAEAGEYIAKIDALGGAVAAIEQGYVQREIQDAAYKFQCAVEKGETIVVGVNKFQLAEKPAAGLLRVDTAVRNQQIGKINALKAARDNARVQESLAALEKAARDERINLMPLILDAVRAYATEGEIC